MDQILEVERKQFGPAEAGCVEDLDAGPIPEADWCRQVSSSDQGLDLLQGQYLPYRGPDLLGLLEPGRGVLANQKRPRRPPVSYVQTLEDLEPAQQECARDWVAKYAEAFLNCKERHKASLAIGGILGRCRVPQEVVEGFLGELLTKSGVEDTGRTRAAVTSLGALRQNRKVFGIPKLTELLSEEAASELQEVGRALGEELEVTELEIPQGSVVSDEEHQEFVVHALTDPDHGTYLNRLPTGVGKTYQLVQALKQTDPKERIVIATDSHEFADELMSRFEVEGLDRDYAKLPKIHCIEGRSEEYQAAAQLGWSGRAIVCGGCPRQSIKRAKEHGVEPCSWILERRAALKAEVVIAQKAHLRLGSFWSVVGKRVARLVVEEDPQTALTRAMTVDRQSLIEFSALLDAQFDSETVSLIRAILTTLTDALTRPESVIWLQPGQPVCMAWEFKRDLGGLASWIRQRQPGEYRNLLPAVEAISRAWRAGESFPLVRMEKGEGFLLNLPVPVPNNIGVLVLDATGNDKLLQATLDRSVEVLDGSRPEQVEIVQLTDSLWSRSRFKKDPEKVTEQLAGVVDRLVSRTGAQRVGVVTYKAFTQGLKDATSSTIETMHFGALRGRDGFKGVDLLIVIGTPFIPSSENRRQALLLGASEDELDVEPEPAKVSLSNGEDLTTYLYPDGPMRQAQFALTGAELAQAVGRGARGDVVPRCGVYVLTSFPLLISDPFRLSTLEQECLDGTAGEVWEKAQTLLEENPDMGRKGLAKRLEISRWLARRIMARHRKTKT